MLQIAKCETLSGAKNKTVLVWTVTESRKNNPICLGMEGWSHQEEEKTFCRFS